MQYAIIDTDKGNARGINPAFHLRLCKGQKMVVNENELRHVAFKAYDIADDDIAAAAEALGGTLMTHSQTVTKIKQLNNE